METNARFKPSVSLKILLKVLDKDKLIMYNFYIIL